MKLIETVKISDQQSMAIYQLSDEVAKKNGKSFMLYEKKSKKTNNH